MNLTSLFFRSGIASVNCFLTVVANLPERTTSVAVILSSDFFTSIKYGAWSIPGPYLYTAKSHPNFIPGHTINFFSLKLE